MTTNLRNVTIDLHQMMNKRNATQKEDPKPEKYAEENADHLHNLPGEKVLFEFMRLAGEPITWIEARELWNDMRSTNNGELPEFSKGE